MLRTLRTTARAVHLRPLQSLQHQATILPLPVLMQHVRTYADKVVKVPQMAESISEGTLKQWSKQVGDFVEQDEEIATIETDKVCQPPLRISICFAAHTWQRLALLTISTLD